MRKNKGSFLKVLLVSIIGILSFTQCTKDEDKKLPTVGEITPSQAEVGDTITISGTNFSDVATNNTVTFTGNDEKIDAIVTKATTTSLDVVVPEMSLGEVQITITANGVTTTAQAFKIVVKPEITGFTGNNGGMGDEVVIKGKNFMPGTESPTVIINGKEQPISSASDTEIKITLVAKTFSGDLIVTNSDGEVSAPELYMYKSAYSFNSTPFIEGYVDWITYTPEGDFYAVTGDRYYVKKFDKNAQELATYMEQGESAEYAPEYLWLSDDGTLYLTEYFGRIFKMDTKTETAFSLFVDNTDPLALKDQMKQISGDNNGNLYFGSGSNNQILKVDAQGTISEIYKSNKHSLFGLQYLNDKIYCATFDEMFSVDTLGNSYKEYVTSNANDGVGFRAESLCMFSENDVYLARKRVGIYKVNMQDASLDLVVSNSELGFSEDKSSMIRMVPTPEGDIVICIASGAYKLTRE